MDRPHVIASIIVCTRDRASRLTAMLESLAALTVPPGVTWEVLVVDNASRDQTRDVIQDFIARGHPQFKYIHEPQPGKTHALNRGIESAAGDILAFTDDDAVVEPGWLAAILAAFEREGADGVGGRVLPIWEAPRPDWLSDDLLNVLAVLDLGPKAFRLTWSGPPWMLYGVNFAFRRTVFERLGGFNTALGSKGEDKELFDRLAASRAIVVYDPAIVVHHHIAAERLTRAYYRHWHWSSGRVRARLEPRGRKLLGIPLFTLRGGARTTGQYIRALLRLDRRAAFVHSLMLRHYAAYYLARATASLTRAHNVAR